MNFRYFITFTTNLEAFVHSVVDVLNLALAVDVSYSHYCKQYSDDCVKFQMRNLLLHTIEV